RMRQWNERDVPGVKTGFALQGTPADAAIVGVGVARVLQLCGALDVPDCMAPGRGRPAGADRPPGAKPPAALPADIAALTRLDAPDGAAPPKAGARIELLSSSARGAPNVAALDVVAAENQGFKELDDVSVIVHLAQAQQLVFGRRTPQATAIMILLRHTADQAPAEARVREILAAWHAPGGGAPQPLVVRTFGELNPFYVQSEQLFNVIFDFIFALIGAIVLFTVGNTMNTAVVERTVEIGTLRAIGLRQSGVRRLFVAEGFVLGCVGAATGIVSAVVLGFAVNHSGLTWLPPASSQRLPLQLRVLGDWPTVVVAALALVAVATASAWWPARRAARLNVVEALRHA
ncbi:MAG: ABC transporter permease, partial [Burkholderiales bacterium]|nr:ABC transporter permease [Burkholderiales bacterium]